MTTKIIIDASADNSDTSLSPMQAIRNHWKERSGKKLTDGGIIGMDIQKALNIVNQKLKARNQVAKVELQKKTQAAKIELLEKMQIIWAKGTSFKTEIDLQISDKIREKLTTVDKAKKKYHHMLDACEKFNTACLSLNAQIPFILANNSLEIADQKIKKAFKVLESIHKEIKNNNPKDAKKNLIKKFYAKALDINFAAEAENKQENIRKIQESDENRNSKTQQQLNYAMQKIIQFAEEQIEDKNQFTHFRTQIENSKDALKTILAIDAKSKDKRFGSFWDSPAHLISFFEFITTKDINAQIKDEMNSQVARSKLRTEKDAVLNKSEAFRTILAEKGLNKSADKSQVLLFVKNLFSGENNAREALLKKTQGIIEKKKIIHDIYSGLIDSIVSKISTERATAFLTLYFTMFNNKLLPQWEQFFADRPELTIEAGINEIGYVAAEVYEKIQAALEKEDHTFDDLKVRLAKMKPGSSLKIATSTADDYEAPSISRHTGSFTNWTHEAAASITVENTQKDTAKMSSDRGLNIDTNLSEEYEAPLPSISRHSNSFFSSTYQKAPTVANSLSTSQENTAAQNETARRSSIDNSMHPLVLELVKKLRYEAYNVLTEMGNKSPSNADSKILREKLISLNETIKSIGSNGDSLEKAKEVIATARKNKSNPAVTKLLSDYETKIQKEMQPRSPSLLSRIF